MSEFSEESNLKLTALVVADQPRVAPTPVQIQSEWVLKTRDRFAQRCLPLLMAEQARWTVTHPGRVSATWMDLRELVLPRTLATTS